ncbi:alkylation response protein AidB-like acyl-CoA dehydrogenase [Catenulispora sp. MAP5-51]|uniref:acyl-CoA dehydrogenase family protein n=1 Tax=Catenulispora sp. MAP5-51 TaxID=3156298 RepID=UPI0035119189
MQLRDTPDQRRFREELRAWLRATLPTLDPQPSQDDWPARRAYDSHWQALLHRAGYAGLNWPAAYGGRGATPTEHLIFLEESELAGAPYVGVNFVGLLHAGPTLIAEASPEQRERHIPAILRGDEIWCQGFSEPDAGSDLAALRTRAVREGAGAGDHYVVNGRKIWTSHAEVADYCELLVRTGPPDGPKHQGITWLIMPMDTPGVSLRPLMTAGGSTEFSEMILEDVRIPVANRVGEEGDGWRIAMVTFAFERGTGFVSEVVWARRRLVEIAALARENAAWEDSGTRRRIAGLAAEFDALWALVKRNVSEAEHSADGIPGPGSSVFKLRFSEARQHLDDLHAEVRGRDALAFDDELCTYDGEPGYERLRSLAYTIAAGTSQVQRNIIGERILGLPKEPSAASAAGSAGSAGTTGTTRSTGTTKGGAR